MAKRRATRKPTPPAPRRRPIPPAPRRGGSPGARHVPKWALALFVVIVGTLAIGVFWFAARVFTLGPADNVDDLDGYLERIATLEESAARGRGDRGVGELLFGPTEDDAMDAWEASVTADPGAVADDGMDRTEEWQAGLAKASEDYEKAAAILQEADRLELADTERARLDAVRETIELHIYSLQLEKKRAQMAEKAFQAFRQADGLAEEARSGFLESELGPLVADWNENVAEQEDIQARQEELSSDSEEPEGL